MWDSTRKSIRRTKLFFLIALSHESLVGYYQSNFQLMQEHKYALTELEEMIPWEREIYIKLLVDYLEEERERIRQQEHG